MPKVICTLAFAALLMSQTTLAAPPAPPPSVPLPEALSSEQQARYYALLEELRCLVCQNQTLAESNAELAGDLRARVLTMVEDGVSDNEILSFMTSRYGDFIRYRPPLKPKTYLLWAAPLILLLVFLAALFKYIIAQSRRGRE